MFMATFGSALYFLSIYFQDVRGYDALEAGVRFLVPTGVVVAGSALAGRAVTRFGIKRTLVTALTSAQSVLSRWVSGCRQMAPTPCLSRASSLSALATA